MEQKDQAGKKEDQDQIASVHDDDSNNPRQDENATAGYNSYWIDSGDGLMRVRGEARSSFITSPADGKMPFRSCANSKPGLRPTRRSWRKQPT